MSAAPRLDFILAGGARHGLGHVMRSRAIAEAARDRGLLVRAYLEGDASAGACWSIDAGLSPPQTWTAWNAADAADWTILDHPFDKRSWLARLRRGDSLAVAIDDERVRGEAPLTVLPGLHHTPRADDDPDRVWAGPRYSILSAVHRETRPVAREDRDGLLLSMGGADPHHVTPKIAPLLARVLRESSAAHGIRRLEVVLGPAFQDPGDAIARRLAREGWQVERGLPAARFAERMARARFAVVGFGTSLTELAWHATPHASITHHERDIAANRALEASGIGRYLGCAIDLDPGTIARRFQRAIEDLAGQREAVRRAHAALEGGRGVELILDALQQRLERKAPPGHRGFASPSLR